MAAYGSATIAAAGTSAATAAQATRLGKTSTYLVTNLAPGGSNELQGVLLPTDPEEGDVVEFFADADGGSFYLYGGTINGQANNSYPTLYYVYCRYTGSTNGWYVAYPPGV